MSIFSPELERINPYLRDSKFLSLTGSLGVDHCITTVRFGHIDVDDPKVDEEIKKSLKLNPESKVVYAGQPHGIEVAYADGSQRIMLGKDGLFTDKPEIILVIRTADCLPILISLNKGDGVVIGALHAGRQGLVKGIIPNFFELLRSTYHEIDVESASVLIGPHICEKCYFFDKDDQRTQDLIDSIGEKYFREDKDQENKIFLNLLELARDQLESQGINAKRIFLSPHCTYESQLFPSYRRIRGENGNDAKNTLFASCLVIRREIN